MNFTSKLYLVGAGPGDSELITLKAIRILGKAEVILYDALANDELLVHCKNAKIKTFVGKRYGCHALSQQEINYLILEHCAKYQHVVRLKGGDPFIFGRAQEEIDAARGAGIDVEIVPGISSALAVPASQNIPLTCRGINESFWVLTGTNKNNQLSADICLAAQSSATIVILMAMSKLESICDIFLRYGKGETPAAIIQDGTKPNSKMVTGTIKDITFRAMAAGLENPAVIVFGEVVKLNPATIYNKIKSSSENPVVLQTANAGKFKNEENKRNL